MPDNLAEQEKKVDLLVENQRNQEAVQLLLKLVTAYAKRKKFEKAEQLREKMFEVDEMALDEIIKSAEIIEEEKSETIDQNHMDIWAKLYDTMDQEEYNALYFSMQSAEFESNDPIFMQGDRNDRLYFINQGELKMFYTQGNRDILLKNLGPGDIVGEDTFFNISLCTTSVVPISRTKAFYLERDIYPKWKNEFPSLASKIYNYCAQVEKPHEKLEKKAMDRRAYKRVLVSGPVMFQVLSHKGQPMGKAFRGDLSDISQGGISFFIKTSNPKNALMLLGRQLEVKFVLPLGDPQKEVSRTGTISGVIDHLHSDYSIHMKFSKIVDRSLIDTLDRLNHKQRIKLFNKPDHKAV